MFVTVGAMRMEIVIHVFFSARTVAVSRVQDVDIVICLIQTGRRTKTKQHIVPGNKHGTSLKLQCMSFCKLLTADWNRFTMNCRQKHARARMSESCFKATWMLNSMASSPFQRHIILCPFAQQKHLKGCQECQEFFVMTVSMTAMQVHHLLLKSR